MVLLLRRRAGNAAAVRSDNADFFSIDDGVRRILDDFVARVEAFDDLDYAAIVLPDGDGHELRRVAVASVDDGDHAQAFLAEKQCGDGKNEGLPRNLHLEVDLGVGAGYEGAVVIGNVDFDEQGAGGGIDGARGANDLTVEAAARIFLEG